MRRIYATATAIFLAAGLTACGESAPQVADPETTTPVPENTQEDSAEQALEEIPDSEPEPEDEFEYGQTVVSTNESYRMTEVGDWNIEKADPTFPGYTSDDEVDDPAELWKVTHPQVDMEGEILLGANMGPTSAKPVIVVESMTEEELPHLNSHYGNAYLIEGLNEIQGYVIYRASIVTDHGQPENIGEVEEYFGNRTPGPLFYFMIHQIDQAAFEEYRDSQARQDLLQMLRTLEIEPPETFAEGVDLEDADLFEQEP